MMKRLRVGLGILLILIVNCCGGSGRGGDNGNVSQNSYTSNFPLTETPISEGGHWINGGILGLDWTNVDTSTHLAYGTQSGHLPPPYDDSIALLTGTWGASQTVQAPVFWNGDSQIDGDFDEVQLLARGTLHNNWWSGYLIDCRVGSSTAGSYIEVGRVNGPLNDFNGIRDDLTCRGVGCNCTNGDVLTLTVVNNASNQPVVSVYKNGVLKARGTDTGTNPFQSGNPGMAFFHQDTHVSNNAFGFSSFTATDSTTGLR